MTRPQAHVAASDCERCRPGLVAQPANTASSLAYAVTGVLALRAARRQPASHPSETVLGWAAVAAGLGSVAYHGPGTALGRYVHDASLLAMLGLVALADAELVAGSPAPAPVVAAVPLAAIAAAHPATSMAAQVAVGVAASVGEGLRMRALPSGGADTWWRRAEAWVAGGGAMLHLLGRTGGPLCRPDSLLQPHAAWHVATASTVWFRSRDLRRAWPR